MTEREPPRVLSPARLPADRDTPVRLVPGSAALAAMAARLGLRGLRKVRLEGRMVPEGAADWRLEATLGATVVQDCRVTLAPVTTRIAEPVVVRYRADPPGPGEGEVEMPEDETVEPLPDRIDLAEVLETALALALPPFPRAEGADLGEAAFGPPGVEPLRDADVAPFAALAELKKRMEE
jgi:uncharacterized metal-binding protein YceD (DUF177 family)